MNWTHELVNVHYYANVVGSGRWNGSSRQLADSAFRKATVQSTQGTPSVTVTSHAYLTIATCRSSRMNQHFFFALDRNLRLDLNMRNFCGLCKHSDPTQNHVGGAIF